MKKWTVRGYIHTGYDGFCNIIAEPSCSTYYDKGTTITSYDRAIHEFVKSRNAAIRGITQTGTFTDLNGNKYRKFEVKVKTALDARGNRRPMNDGPVATREICVLCKTVKSKEVKQA